MPGLKSKADRKPGQPQELGNEPGDEPGKKPRKPRRHGFSRTRMAPTQRVEHVVEQCPGCGTGLSGGWTHRTREVIDLRAGCLRTPHPLRRSLRGDDAGAGGGGPPPAPGVCQPGVQTLRGHWVDHRDVGNGTGRTREHEPHPPQPGHRPRLRRTPGAVRAGPAHLFPGKHAGTLTRYKGRIGANKGPRSRNGPLARLTCWAP